MSEGNIVFMSSSFCKWGNSEVSSMIRTSPSWPMWLHDRAKSKHEGNIYAYLSLVTCNHIPPCPHHPGLHQLSSPYGTVEITAAIDCWQPSVLDSTMAVVMKTLLFSPPVLLERYGEFWAFLHIIHWCYGDTIKVCRDRTMTPVLECNTSLWTTCFTSCK